MSLKGSISTTKLFDTVEDYINGEKDASEKLYHYAEVGMISNELYDDLIRTHFDEHCANVERKKNELALKTEKKNKTKKIAMIILCIVLLLSLATVAVVYHNNAVDEAYSKGFKSGNKKGYDKGYDEGYDKGFGYYQEISDEYNFYHRYAVITTSNGKKYHRYDCYHIRNRSVYIYNISNAKAQGYTACLNCYD